MRILAARIAAPHEMNILDLRKPDGRRLTLYGRQPINPLTAAPSPFAEPPGSYPHLRWHPLRGEWVAYAVGGQGPHTAISPQSDALKVTVDAEHPTELPAGDWEVAVFDDRYPSLGAPDEEVVSTPSLIVPAAPAFGHCEVVVFTQDAKVPLGALPLARIELLLQVFADRTDRLARQPNIAYVLPFEDRGVPSGDGQRPPHGQIYAYPVVPPVPERMQQQAAQHYVALGRGLLQDLIERERKDAVRMLYEGTHAVAFVPVCARYPYEAWVATIEPVATFSQLDAAQIGDLARAIKTVLLKYDCLGRGPLPYLMAWYQAPTDGQRHPESHLHAQFYPSYCARERLNSAAGGEIATGFFAMDSLPENQARELQLVDVALN